MKITAKLSVILAAIFSTICFGVALTIFASLDDAADPTRLADAKGFAWFWTFLGLIGVAFGAIGVWLVKTHKEEDAR